MTERPDSRPSTWRRTSRSTDNLVRSLARVHDDALAGQAGRPAARRLMDDITAAPHQEAARPRRRSPRLAVRIAAVGTVAAIASAAGVTLVGDDDHGRPRQVIPHVGSVAQAAVVLDRAAAAAKSRPYTAPGPQQWLYTEFRTTAPAVPSGIATGAPTRRAAGSCGGAWTARTSTPPTRTAS
ncbi:hypothetical protein [Spirillospora sp. CA-128828]|uniref:hypothetical protein n=1 Tax=Spirillospora sp. CA-128828 TaxID=3240033 RepID=UPI003D92D470